MTASPDHVARAFEMAFQGIFSAPPPRTAHDFALMARMTARADGTDILDLPRTAYRDVTPPETGGPVRGSGTRGR